MICRSDLIQSSKSSSNSRPLEEIKGTSITGNQLERIPSSESESAYNERFKMPTTTTTGNRGSFFPEYDVNNKIENFVVACASRKLNLPTSISETPARCVTLTAI